MTIRKNTAIDVPPNDASGLQGSCSNSFFEGGCLANMQKTIAAITLVKSEFGALQLIPLMRKNSAIT